MLSEFNIGRTGGLVTPNFSEVPEKEINRGKEGGRNNRRKGKGGTNGYDFPYRLSIDFPQTFNSQHCILNFEMVFEYTYMQNICRR